jgi:ABC-type long-subunit fatty acid transport system fused permease/ATPase subunit
MGQPSTVIAIGLIFLALIGVGIGCLIEWEVSNYKWRKAITSCLSEGWANKIERKRNGWKE